MRAESSRRAADREGRSKDLCFSENRVPQNPSKSNSLLWFIMVCHDLSWFIIMKDHVSTMFFFNGIPHSQTDPFMIVSVYEWFMTFNYQQPLIPSLVHIQHPPETMVDVGDETTYLGPHVGDGINTGQMLTIVWGSHHAAPRLLI